LPGPESAGVRRPPGGDLRADRGSPHGGDASRHGDQGDQRAREPADSAAHQAGTTRPAPRPGTHPPGHSSGLTIPVYLEVGARRVADLVGACWTYLDRVVAAAPAELRKGPRGGGRDRDKIVAHVIGAEAAYAGKLGIRPRNLPPDEAGPGSAVRAALLGVLGAASNGEPRGEAGRPSGDAARRIASPALDHAREREAR